MKIECRQIWMKVYLIPLWCNVLGEKNFFMGEVIFLVNVRAVEAISGDIFHGTTIKRDLAVGCVKKRGENEKNDSTEGNSQGQENDANFSTEQSVSMIAYSGWSRVWRWSFVLIFIWRCPVPSIAHYGSNIYAAGFFCPLCQVIFSLQEFKQIWCFCENKKEEWTYVKLSL